MANKKITELNEIVTIADTDVLPIVDLDGTETMKVEVEDLKEYVVGDTSTLTTTSTEVVGAINELDSDTLKLNNITKYLTATAGSNGDFYVDIDNALETNMIVNVIFPLATSLSSQARLSIDGGTTYKNISDLLAQFVYKQKLTLRYDGTKFVIATVSPEINSLGAMDLNNFKGSTIRIGWGYSLTNSNSCPNSTVMWIPRYGYDSEQAGTQQLINVLTGAMYTRSYSGGAWTSWQ